MAHQKSSDLKTGKRPVQQQIKTLSAGEILFEEGSTGRELFIVQEGKVRVYKDSPDGKIELATIEKGGIIGEMSLLDNLPRSATVKACEPAKIIVVNQGMFQSVMQAVPMWLQSIVKIVVSRLRDANKRVDQAVLRDKERGIISLLHLLLPVHKKEIDSCLALDCELLDTEAYFVCRLRKKEVRHIIENTVKRGIFQLGENKEKSKKYIIIKDLEVFQLYEEYLCLKSQKKSFRESAIPEEAVATLSNIAYVAQKSGRETDEGTVLMKSALMEDLSDKDSGRLEKNLMELRRKNCINMLPQGADISILFKKETLSRIKKIKEWLPKFQMDLQ